MSMTEENSDIPKSWIRLEIGRLCDLKNGRAFKPSDWTAKGLKIVRIQNLNNADASYNHYSGEVRERFIIKNGDLLFAWSGTPGTSFGAHIWRGEKAVLNQHIFRVDFDETMISKKYFMYAINQKLNELIEKAHGGVGLRHVTKGKFEETRIEVPPFREQSRIVAKIEVLFSELDKGIESLKTVLEQLDVYRQVVLKHAFEGKLTAQWRNEHKAELERADQLIARLKKEREACYLQQIADWKAATKKWDLKGQKDKRPSKPRLPKPLSKLSDDGLAALADLPGNWAWEKLGWMTCGVEYGTAAKSSKVGSIPVIRMGNLQNGKIDWDDLLFTSGKEEIEKYSLNPSDVLFNRTNSPELVGKTAIYRGERAALFAGYLIRINQIGTIANSQYVNLFLNSHVARQHGNTVKTDGVNQSNINGEKLQAYPFPYCSLAEQCEVVRALDEKLSLTDQMMQEIDAQLIKSNALRQSILKMAFSGQLVAQDPKDEPASVLLDRIRIAKEEQEKNDKINKRKDAA